MARFVEHTDGKTHKVASRFVEHTDGKTHAVVSRWVVDASGIIRKIWESVQKRLIPYTNFYFTHFSTQARGSLTCGGTSYTHYNGSTSYTYAGVKIDNLDGFSHEIEFDISFSGYRTSQVGIAYTYIDNSNWSDSQSRTFSAAGHYKVSWSSSFFVLSDMCNLRGSYVTISNLTVDGVVMEFQPYSWSKG